MINPSTTYAGVSGPSASAYVTYCSNNDALRAIQSVNNIMVDGRLIKTSLGTTKYCSHFMKNQQCPKLDCMYLHELGDLEASFTKEEMHQGKHQEYEKRLHDALIALTAAANNNNNNNSANGTSNGTNGNSSSSTNPNNSTDASSPNGKLSECNKQAGENGPEKNKDAWPSLSISPVNKDATNKSNKNGSNKENGGKKSKAEKSKNKKASSSSSSSSATSNTSNSTSTNANNSISGNVSASTETSQKSSSLDSGFITKDHTNGEMSNPTMSADEELNLLSEIENDTSSNDLDGKADTPSLSMSSSGDSGTVSESVSGKSSPTNFSDHAADTTTNTQHDVDKKQNKTNLEKTSQSRFADNFSTAINNGAEINTNCVPLTNGLGSNVIDTSTRFAKLGLFDDNNSFFSSNTFQPSPFFGKTDASQTQLRTNDVTIPTSSAQLPDLLSGTESDKERHDLHEKLSILKSLGDFGPQLNSLQNGYGSNSGLDELQKRRNLVNGLGLGSGGLLGIYLLCFIVMND